MGFNSLSRVGRVVPGFGQVVSVSSSGWRVVSGVLLTDGSYLPALTGGANRSFISCLLPAPLTLFKVIIHQNWVNQTTGPYWGGSGAYQFFYEVRDNRGELLATSPIYSGTF